MAVLDQPVLGDLGSEEVELMRAQLNLAITFIDNFKIALAAAADLAALKTAVAALVTTDMRTIVLTKTLPPARRFPTHA
jgi:hypothetical protein